MLGPESFGFGPDLLGVGSDLLGVGPGLLGVGPVSFGFGLEASGLDPFLASRELQAGGRVDQPERGPVPLQVEAEDLAGEPAPDPADRVVSPFDQPEACIEGNR